MRTLVHPPPTLRCDFCHGELRLKQTSSENGRVSYLDIDIFACVKCGHEKVHMVMHDPYVAHTASSRPPR